MGKKCSIKIHKMGPKMGMSFSNKWLRINGYTKGDIVNIIMRKNNKEISFLTKINIIISLHRETVVSLGLRYKDIVEIRVNKVCNLERSTKLFRNNEIDLLSLIPHKTSCGYEITVIEFAKENEKWLRIWYSHRRGSARQIEFKRFINIKTLGCLLGQLQAEGTKKGRKFRLDFCNKLISEHKDFVSYLEQIGISKKSLIAELTLHRNFKDDKDTVTSLYQKETGVLIKYVQNSLQRGNYGFRTYKRSTILTEVFLNVLHTMRKKLIEEEWNNNLKIFADSFFSKLLTGDGSIDIQTKNRESNYPFIRITITDGNHKYLNDYSYIMKKLGFKPHLYYKYNKVRAICSLEKLLYLYKIRAFENSNNWNKLLLCIDLCLKGRRYKTNYRFIDLLKLEKFANLHIMKNYNVKLSSADDWLGNKEKEGLVKRINTKSPIEWSLTEKSIKLAVLLKSWQKEFNKLIIDYKMQDPLDILNSIKIRSKHFQPNKPAI
jgi:hypothetical protein